MDEQFGTPILRDAAAKGFHLACPAEKSGQDEFDFEYGDDFAKHIEKFNPTFCKVLVRYNPEGDAAINRQQAERLKKLSDYLQASQRSLFMFELLVPAEKAQLDKVNGRQEGLRPRIAPGPDGAGDSGTAGRRRRAGRVEDRRAGPPRRLREHRQDSAGQVRARMWAASCSGAARTTEKVREWLLTAASVPGFIGFAVGRTDFWDPLVAWRDKKSSRDEAVAAIADHYSNFVQEFETASAHQIET